MKKYFRKQADYKKCNEKQISKGENNNIKIKNFEKIHLNSNKN